MKIDRRHLPCVVVRDRPLLLPGLGILVLCSGSVALWRQLWSGGGDPMSWIGIVASLVLGGGLFLHSARWSAHRFDPGPGVWSWSCSRMWGRGRGQMSLTDIENVRLERGPDSEDLLHRVVLETRHGQRYLQVGFSSDDGAQREVIGAIREAVAIAREGHRARP